MTLPTSSEVRTLFENIQTHIVSVEDLTRQLDSHKSALKDIADRIVAVGQKLFDEEYKGTDSMVNDHPFTFTPPATTAPPEAAQSEPTTTETEPTPAPAPENPTPSEPSPVSEPSTATAISDGSTTTEPAPVTEPTPSEPTPSEPTPSPFV